MYMPEIWDYIVLDRWALTEFDMVYGGRSTPRGNGVPVYYPLLGVNLDGIFVGEIRMTGITPLFSRFDRNNRTRHSVPEATRAQRNAPVTSH